MPTQWKYLHEHETELLQSAQPLNYHLPLNQAEIEGKTSALGFPKPQLEVWQLDLASLQ